MKATCSSSYTNVELFKARSHSDKAILIMPSDLSAFGFHQSAHLFFGEGSFCQLGKVARSLHGSNVLIVTDPGLLETGYPQEAGKILADHGISASFFSEVIENPTSETVSACAEMAKRNQVDVLVGLGGGSSIDTAKGCNFILTNGGRMEDYWGYGKATRPLLPLIAIPTTAGTGSECQSYALISDATTHRKMACGDAKAAPSAAILDPCLTLTQPQRVTACTGIDAIAHAVESFVTTRRTPLSNLFAREAFHLMAKAFSQVLQNPNQVDSRGKMLLGASYAGIAIENSMLGSAHAAANPLTAQYGIIHGQAVGVMLPAVVRYNALVPEVNDMYRQLIKGAGLEEDLQTEEIPAGEVLALWLEDAQLKAGLPKNLMELGVPKEDIPELAHQAADQWTVTFNPRPMKTEQLTLLYEAASGY